MMEKSWPKTDSNESVATKGSNNSNLFEFLDMTSCDEKEKIQLKNTLYSNNNINNTFNSTPPPARFRGSINNNANRNPKFTQQPSLPASNLQQSSPHNNSHQQTNYIHQPIYQKHDFHEPSSRIARTFPDAEYHHYNNTKNNNSNKINHNTKTNNTNNSNKRLDDNRYFNEKWHNNSKKAPYAGIRENTTTSSSQYSSQSSVNSKKDYKRNKDNVHNYQNKEPFNRDGQTISTMSPPLTSNSQQSASTTSSSTPSTPNSSQNNVIVHQQQQQQQQLQQQQQQQQQIPHYSAQPLQYGNPPLHQPPPQAVYQTTAPMSIIQQGMQGNMFVGHHGYLPGPPGTQQMIPASYLHNEMQQQRVDSGSGRDNQSQREDQRDSNSQVPMNTIVRGGGNSNRRGGRSRGGSGGTRREYQPRHQSQNQQPPSEYIQPMMDQQQAVMGAGGYAQYYIQPYPQYYAQAPNTGHIANIHSASQATAATAQSLTGQPLYIQAPMYGYPYPYPYGYPMFHPMMQTQPHLAHHQHSGEIVIDENQIAEGASVVVNESIPQMWHPHPHMAYQQEHPPPHIYQQTPHQNDVDVEEYQQNQPEYILMANPNQINYQLINSQQQQQQQQQQQSGEEMVDEMSLNDAQGFQQQSQLQQYDDNIQINNEQQLMDQQMIVDGNIDDNSIIVEKTRDLMIQTDEVKSHQLQQQQQQQHLVNVQTNTINSENNNNINVSYDDSIEKDISIVTKTTPDTINVEFISNINVNKSNSNVSVNNEHHMQINHQNVPNSSCSPGIGQPQPSAIVVSVLPSATQINTSNVINDSSVNNSKANSIELGTSKLNNNTDSKLMIKNKEKPPAWGNVISNTPMAITTNPVAVITPTVMKKQTASVSVSAIPTDLQTKTHHHQQPQQPPPPFSNSNIIAGNLNETVPKNLVMTTIPANQISPQQQNQPQTIYENSFSPQSHTTANTTTTNTNKTAVNTNTNSFSSIMTSQQQQQQILTAADKKTETHQAMTEKAKQEFVSTITAANTLSSDVSRRPEPSPQRIQNIQTQTSNKDVKIENIRDTAQQTIAMSSAKSPTVTAASSSSVSWAGLLKGVPVGQSQRATPPHHVTSPTQMAGNNNNNNNNKPLSKLSLPVQVSTDNTPQKSISGPTITQQMPSNTSPGVLSYSAASAQGLQSPPMATMPSPTPFPITANKKLPQKTQPPAAIIKRTPADEYSLKLGDWLSKYKIETNSLSLMPRGLLNKSNYCYINAILQALVACPPFYHLMTSLPIQPPSCKADSKTPVTDAMVELVSNYNALPYRKWQPREKGKKEDVPDIQTDSAFEPSVILKLLNTIRSDMFPVEGRQEDAEEFLGFILNRMNDEMIELIKIVEKPKMMQPEKPVAVSTSIPIENGQEDDGANTDEDPIEWQVISGTRNKGTVTRTTDFGRSPISDIFGGKMRSRVHREGDHSTDNIQPFFTLPLDIEKAASVREALEILVGRDQLEGVTCSRTNQEIAAWQQVTLEELPVVLILHLKCFDFKKEGCTKILKTVEFPVELKMDPKIMSSKVKYNQKQKHYKLFAVVYHDGKEASKGHYVTDVFHIGYSNWIRYDDSTVKPISEHIVLHPRSPRVPYLLYYRRYDTICNSHSNRERDHHFSSSSNTSTSSHYHTDHNRHGKATK